jgi:hypothetical protein
MKLAARNVCLSSGRGSAGAAPAMKVFARPAEEPAPGFLQQPLEHQQCAQEMTACGLQGSEPALVGLQPAQGVAAAAAAAVTFAEARQSFEPDQVACICEALMQSKDIDKLSR